MSRLSLPAPTCPQCNAGTITYTCEPDCCFNHICDACYTTFELATIFRQQTCSVTDFDTPSRDSCDPTLPCEQCESIEVYRFTLEDKTNTLVCVDCHALLDMAYTEITPRG
jgi:hypothetical protein